MSSRLTSSGATVLWRVKRQLLAMLARERAARRSGAAAKAALLTRPALRASRKASGREASRLSNPPPPARVEQEAIRQAMQAAGRLSPPRVRLSDSALLH